MLETVVTADMLSGVLDEVVGLLPIVIPVSITFIALRKGISFLTGALKSAQFVKGYKEFASCFFIALFFAEIINC